MPHGAALIGLTFDGTDLQRSDLSAFFEIESGLHDGLEVRGRDTVVPALAGRIVRNRVADRRVIQLRGFIRGEGADADAQGEAFRAMAQEMEALFDQTADPDDLVATLEDGTSLTIAARTLEIHFMPQTVPILQRIEVDLESVAPNWTPSGS